MAQLSRAVVSSSQWQLEKEEIKLAIIARIIHIR